MSSKRLIFPLVLAITLHGLSMQTTSQAIDVGVKPSVSLSRGQEYQLKAMENNSYTAMASFDMEFAAFDPYLPKRDKGQAAVYWKVNEVGFYIGYDGSKWKLDTRWETE